MMRARQPEDLRETKKEQYQDMIRYSVLFSISGFYRIARARNRQKKFKASDRHPTQGKREEISRNIVPQGT